MKKTVIKVLLIYVIVWMIIVAAFWFGLRSEPMLFSIAAFYIALPLTTFLVSLYLGRQEGCFKWLFLPFAGLMQFLAPFLTFNVANMIAFSKGLDQVVLPDIYSAFFSIIPAALGIFIGMTKLKKKEKMDKNKEIAESNKQ